MTAPTKISIEMDQVMLTTVLQGLAALQLNAQAAQAHITDVVNKALAREIPANAPRPDAAGADPARAEDAQQSGAAAAVLSDAGCATP